MPPQGPSSSFFTEDLELRRPLDAHEVETAKREYQRLLRVLNYRLWLVSEPKCVGGPGRTVKFVQPRVAPEHRDLVYAHPLDAETFLMFYVSDKFEPYVICTIVGATPGAEPDADPRFDMRHRLVTFEAAYRDGVRAGVEKFVARFGLCNGKLEDVRVHYTPAQEREGSYGAGNTRAHSRNFHFKILVASRFVSDHAKIYSFIEIDKCRQNLGVVKYNYGRQTRPFLEVLQEF
jgi:hypothetical protein